MPVEVSWVPSNIIEQKQNRLRTVPTCLTARSAKHMRTLGGKAERRMKYAVMENVYTGKLQDSIKDAFLTVLVGAYHSRVKYPEVAKTPRRARRGGPEAPPPPPEAGKPDPGLDGRISQTIREIDSQ